MVLTTAEQMAGAVAAEHGYPAPVRVFDTDYTGDPAWVVVAGDAETGGIVVYEDEPDCLVSVGWDDGRWTLEEPQP